MKIAVLILPILVLAACETGTSSAPAEPRWQSEPAEPGIRVSGYARVGVSSRF